MGHFPQESTFSQWPLQRQVSKLVGTFSVERSSNLVGHKLNSIVWAHQSCVMTLNLATDPLPITLKVLLLHCVEESHKGHSWGTRYPTTIMSATDSSLKARTHPNQHSPVDMASSTTHISANSTTHPTSHFLGGWPFSCRHQWILAPGLTEQGLGEVKGHQ